VPKITYKTTGVLTAFHSTEAAGTVACVAPSAAFDAASASRAMSRIPIGAEVELTIVVTIAADAPASEEGAPA
jgi:hypothetical protein